MSRRKKEGATDSRRVPVGISYESLVSLDVKERYKRHLKPGESFVLLSITQLENLRTQLHPTIKALQDAMLDNIDQSDPATLYSVRMRIVLSTLYTLNDLSVRALPLLDSQGNQILPSPLTFPLAVKKFSR